MTIFTLDAEHKKKEFSLLENGKKIEEISSDGTKKIRIPIENGETLIFESNNVVKDGQENEGTYEIKGDHRHIAILQKERFYFFDKYKEHNIEKTFLTSVTSEYKIICDESCTYVYTKEK